MMDAARLHAPSLPTDDMRVLRYELPLARPGGAAGAARLSSIDADADYRPGNLRVRVLQAEGLPARSDGSNCEPYATVAVAELTRRRTRRTAAARGTDVEWGEAFDFDAASACAQVVVDVWDRPGAGPADLLGKAVLNLNECRPGVPHTYFKHLLEGKVVRAPLPRRSCPRRDGSPDLRVCRLSASRCRCCGCSSTSRSCPPRRRSRLSMRPTTRLPWTDEVATGELCRR